MSVDPETLLRALHPDGSYFTICAFGKGRKPKFAFFRNVADAMKYASRLDAEASWDGVYFLVPDLARRPERGRGREADAVAVRALWIDTDALDFEPLRSRADALIRNERIKKKAGTARVWRHASSEDRDAAKGAALKRINDAVAARQLPAYSALVDSGRGWHAYWLLTEPATGPDLRLVKGTNRKMAEIASADTAIDLARVLKVPGTFNRKDPAAPIRSTLAFFDGTRRYTLAALAELVGAEPERLAGDPKPGRMPSNTGPSQRTSATRTADETRDTPAPSPPEAWLQYMNRSPKARATWEGTRTDLKDTSRSGYAMALASLAAKGAGVRDVNEITAIIAAAPSTADRYREKPDSCRRTAEKALAAPLVFDATKELRKLVPAVWDQLRATNEPPTLFSRGGRLTQLRSDDETPVLVTVGENEAHGLVFRAGPWVKFNKDGKAKAARPPKDIARDLVAYPHSRLPRIKGIAFAPTFTPEWNLLATAGYHTEARLYLHLDKSLADLPTIPEHPSREQITAAVATLDDVICDFPFQRASDRAHALGAFVQPFVRAAIVGPTPLHDIESPTPGTGKSLLAALIGLVATGAPVASTTFPTN